MGVSTLEVTGSVPGQVRKLSVADAIRLSEVGIIGELERLELVDGVLVEMSPEGLPHALVIRNINGVMSLQYPWPTYEIRVGTTFPLSEYHYRVPDLAIGRRVDDWVSPDDLLLMVEVAQTSLKRDLAEKAAAYASWGASTYWVVDVAARRVVVFSDRGPQRYASVTQVEATETIELPGLGSHIQVADILPARP